VPAPRFLLITTALLLSLVPLAPQASFADGAGDRPSLPPPIPAADAGFIAFGDAGTADSAQHSVADEMRRWVQTGHRVDALVEAGDNVYAAGNPSNLDHALDAPYADLPGHPPLWVALGNHDEEGASKELRHLDLPEMPYEQSLPGVQLLFLDANHPDAAQARWLDARLSEPGPALRVVVFHQPAYSCGPHGSTRAVDRWWVPVLERHRVALVVNGHDHYYERFRSKRGVTYVVSGGGGAPLYHSDACDGVPPSKSRAERHHFLGVEVEGNTLTLTTVARNGDVLDRAVIHR
jgi:hypothetical protein